MELNFNELLNAAVSNAIEKELAAKLSTVAQWHQSDLADINLLRQDVSLLIGHQGKHNERLEALEARGDTIHDSALTNTFFENIRNMAVRLDAVERNIAKGKSLEASNIIETIRPLMSTLMDELAQTTQFDDAVVDAIENRGTAVARIVSSEMDEPDVDEDQVKEWAAEVIKAGNFEVHFVD